MGSWGRGARVGPRAAAPRPPSSGPGPAQPSPLPLSAEGRSAAAAAAACPPARFALQEPLLEGGSETFSWPDEAVSFLGPHLWDSCFLIEAPPCARVTPSHCFLLDPLGVPSAPGGGGRPRECAELSVATLAGAVNLCGALAGQGDGVHGVI